MIGTAMDVMIGFSRERQGEVGPGRDAERLLAAIRDLSYLREVPDVIRVVRDAARELSGADGVTFVLPEGDLVHYVDEDAIGPLWKGRRFPANACVSGLAMRQGRTIVIEDVYADPRVPVDAYRPTFVKSLCLVPVRPGAPLAAIGTYWASRHRATQREVELLEALAGSTAVALANAQLYDSARRATQMRDEFLGIVAHELRTPLTPLRLQLGRMERQLASASTEAAALSLERLVKQVDRLSRIVDEILDVSRLRNGVPTLELEAFDLAAVAREVAEEFRELPGAEAGLEVAATGPVVGRWDRQRVRQAVSNLVANAVKYGAGKPIRIAVEDEVARARLTVSDQGIGIAAEDQERIFGRFERAASARHFGGFGVGLWIVGQIVDAHQGVVTVESRLGEGSRFCVVLPK